MDLSTDIKFIMIAQTIRKLLSDEVGQKKVKIYLLWFLTVVNFPAKFVFFKFLYLIFEIFITRRCSQYSRSCDRTKKYFNTKTLYKRKTSGAALHISSNKFISKVLA